jgi:ATP phosphoribosyltransferase
MNQLQNLNSAERIFVPKGTDNQASIESFQQFADIEVPDFKGRELRAESQGREFWLVKARDIPAYVRSGGGDLGIVGSDVYQEYANTERLDGVETGPAVCRFSVLALPEKVAMVEEKIASMKTVKNWNYLYPIYVTTGLPKIVQEINDTREAPFAPKQFIPTGSVEAAILLDPCKEGVGADLVSTGETARQNGLLEVFKLRDIYPMVIGAREIWEEGQ